MIDVKIKRCITPMCDIRQNIKYKGYLMLDDIYYNDAMRNFWSSIVEEKYDISNIGHHSGTGLVIFN